MSYGIGCNNQARSNKIPQLFSHYWHWHLAACARMCGYELSKIGAGKQSLLLRKSGTCSPRLGHLSSPTETYVYELSLCTCASTSVECRISSWKSLCSMVNCSGEWHVYLSVLINVNKLVFKVYCVTSLTSLLFASQSSLLSRDEGLEMSRRSFRGEEGAQGSSDKSQQSISAALGLGQRSFCLSRVAVNAHKIPRINDIESLALNRTSLPLPPKLREVCGRQGRKMVRTKDKEGCCRMLLTAYGMALALTNPRQQWPAAQGLSKTGPFNCLSRKVEGSGGPDPLPEELLAVNVCWRRGIIFFSDVATGKLPMPQ